MSRIGRPFRFHRLSARDFCNAPTFEGDLTAAYIKTCFFASLRDPANNVTPPVLPDLSQGVLIGLGDDILVLRGMERIQTADGRMGLFRNGTARSSQPYVV